MSAWLALALLLGMGALVGACGQAADAGTPAPGSRTPSPDALATLLAGQDAASATPAPVTAVALQSTPTPYPTNTPRYTQTAVTQVILNTATPDPAAGSITAYQFDELRERRDHYWLERPFPRDPTNAIRDFAARSYPYGSKGGGGFQVHHGVDIQNGYGTGILATGSGVVFYAGDDSDVQFGPANDFYGNLVVIMHDQPAPDGRNLFTLYGHMARVEVEINQRVEVGQRIGQVGSTGVALGSHLHFEVRIGDPFDYGSTYNPDLWLRPWPTYGVLAGRITDRTGKRLYDTWITLQPLAGGPNRLAFSYASDSVNPDPYYGEHFTYGDLPAGEYQVVVRISGVLRFKGTVMIEEGTTSWIDIRLS